MESEKEIYLRMESQHVGTTLRSFPYLTLLIPVLFLLRWLLHPLLNVCPCGYNSFDHNNGVRLHLNDRCQEGDEKSEASGQDLRTLLAEALTITQWTLPNSRVGSCRRSGIGNCAMPRSALCRTKITSETRIRRMMT